MKQKKLLIVMVCVLALALAACGGDKDGGSGGSGGASGEGASGAAADAAATAQYESEAKLVRELMGADRVYWSAGQTHYHLFADCAELATTDAAGATTTAPMTGTAAQALAAIPGASLCLICDNRALTTTGL
ncbi:MAG: hypothetical protein LBR00_00880, partial [Clostridiales Family XIII bacterium]|nr:hypothetical protein [Clostridiales Family XIII bacterium]